jgi:AraC-like DNA-binding protein
MKITLFEYLRMYRMFMATVMLHGESSVLEISLDCGYESLSSSTMISAGTFH